MTQLSRRAESERLCLLLGVPPERLAFLADMPTHETHVLVQAVLRAQSSIGVATLQPLIFWAQRLPPRWLAAISQWWLSPVVVAMLATRLPAARASRIAEYLDAGYLAEVCADLDPRAARDIIRRLSQKQLVRTALALLARQDYATAGRFVDGLQDEALVEILERMPDDEALLHAAYFIENRRQLDHVLRLLPEARLRNAILLVLDPQRDVLLPVLSLMIHVGAALQCQLGDIAAEQDDVLLTHIISVVDSEQLWADLLPVLARFSEAARVRFLRLPILCQQSGMMSRILATVARDGLWADLLPCVDAMPDALQTVVADWVHGLSDEGVRKACMGALTGEHWTSLLRVVTRLSVADQQRFLVAMDELATVDDDLVARVLRQGREMGLVQPQQVA
ncbi:magnesium and cobalt transport protein CorA [Perlucidibaca piscinae]|uniref:hypothetical protein n=1 Tax=Perlucidibaca piscinae TaxID=392589 RepID=UPI0003B7910D|nr:hypothetical protein [Perlucidibaca piscinae]